MHCAIVKWCTLAVPSYNCQFLIRRCCSPWCEVRDVCVSKDKGTTVSQLIKAKFSPCCESERRTCQQRQRDNCQSADQSKIFTMLRKWETYVSAKAKGQQSNSWSKENSHHVAKVRDVRVSKVKGTTVSHLIKREFSPCCGSGRCTCQSAKTKGQLSISWSKENSHHVAKVRDVCVSKGNGTSVSQLIKGEFSPCCESERCVCQQRQWDKCQSADRRRILTILRKFEMYVSAKAKRQLSISWSKKNSHHVAKVRNVGTCQQKQSGNCQSADQRRILTMLQAEMLTPAVSPGNWTSRERGEVERGTLPGGGICLSVWGWSHYKVDRHQTRRALVHDKQVIAFYKWAVT